MQINLVPLSLINFCFNIGDEKWFYTITLKEKIGLTLINYRHQPRNPIFLQKEVLMCKNKPN